MAKYGKTDPAVYIQRDMQRRLTRLEKKLTNHILRQGALSSKLATKIASLSAPADLEEE